MELAKYYFVCSCGQMSQELGKEYIRLRKSQKWNCKDCIIDTSNIIQEFKGGYVTNEPDF